MASTFKAPTGAKHDRCIDHVPHPFPKSGKLCIGPTIGREGMIAFADEMAAKTAAHRAAFLAERPERPESWSIGTGKARKLRPIGDFRGHPVVPSVCDGTRCHESSVHAHGGADVFATPAGSHAGIAEQAARFNARRGRTVEPDTYVAAVARKAIERVGRASMSKREAARRASVEREARPVAPAPVADAPELCPGTDRVLTLVYADGRFGGAEKPGMERCPVCDRLVLALMTGEGKGLARLARHTAPTEPVSEPEPIAEPVEEAPERFECGSGSACIVSDSIDAERRVNPDALPVGVHSSEIAAARCRAMFGPADPAPVEEPAPAPAPVAPVLAVVATSRPTCERCGQSFRKSGNGLAWHVANRPDCAERRLSVVA